MGEKAVTLQHVWEGMGQADAGCKLRSCDLSRMEIDADKMGISSQPQIDITHPSVSGLVEGSKTSKTFPVLGYGYKSRSILIYHPIPRGVQFLNASVT